MMTMAAMMSLMNEVSSEEEDDDECNAEFDDLTNREKRAVKDIENNQLWQNFYIILRTTYPAL